MNKYDFFMSPFEKLLLTNARKSCIPLAYGKTLEIGIGTGATFPYYRYDKIDELVGLDIKLSDKIIKNSKYKCILKEGVAENLPFADNTFDTVVISLVLCSVVSIDNSVAEIKRVLKPNGKLVFIEHILPSKTKLAAVFNRANKFWSCCTSGCNINRQTDNIIINNFQVEFINRVGSGIFCYGTAINGGAHEKT